MFQHLKSIWQLVHCSTFNTQDISTLQTSCIVQIQRWNLGSMGSWDMEQINTRLGSWASHCFRLLQLTQLSVVSSGKMKSESSVQRLSERRLDSVEELHGVWDAVEGQNAGLVVQEHSHFHYRITWELRTDVVMSELLWRERKITPTTCHCVQMHIRHSSLICWYSCMQQLLRP